MPRTWALSAACALLCLSVAPAFSQYTVKRILFQGTTPYAQADLEAASGLKPGDPLTDAGLAAAAAKLNATGDFDDIRASLDGPMKAIDVIFKIKQGDPSRRYLVRFDNFPWWTAPELAAAIHQRVPLFNGTLPEAGDQQDAVSAALQQILLTQQIAAKIASDIVPPGPGHPLRTLRYSVVSPQIRFASIDIQGASPALAPALAKLTTALTGRPYSETAIDRLLTPYRNAGFLEATLTDVHRAIDATAAGVQIHFTAKLTEGAPYHVSAIDFPGSPLVSAEQFSAAQTLHVGDIASQQALRDTLAVLDTAYRHQGYMDVGVDATPKLDPATHQVAYTVTLVPGEQYRVGTLTVLNLPPQQRQEFDSAWKLQPGTLYDPIYAANFLKNNTALRSLAEYAASFTAEADPDTHLVSFTMTFVRGGARTQPAQ